MDCIKKSFPCGERKRLLICVISTFIFGLAAHAYGLLNNIFSHDSLNALYADSTENLAKIAVGRFLVPVVRMFRGPIALPWLIGLIALVLISLSVYLTVKIFDVKSNLAAVLISGFMVTNVTVTAITATYVHELDIDMFALFLSCLAAYFWKKEEKISDLISVAVFSLLSMAIYQSYAEVTVTLMIMVLILNVIEGEKVKDIVIKGIKGVVPVGIASVVYFALNKLFCTVFKTDALSRIDITAEYDESLVHRFVELIKGIVVSFLSPSAIYSVIIIAVANILIVCGIAVAVIVRMKKNKVSVGGVLITLALAAMLPVGMNFVCLFSHDDVHDVMKFSFWFIYVFAAVLLFRYLEQTNRKIIKTVSLIIAAVLIWNNVLVSNTAYLKKDLEHDVTITTLERVIEDLEKRDDYVIGETEIAFSGYPQIHRLYPGFDRVSRITGLRFTMASGGMDYTSYFNPYDNLFKYFFNYPMNVSDSDYHKYEEVKAMPSYPQDGYIQNIDGVLVVKLGEKKLPSLGTNNLMKDINKLKDIII